MAVVVTKEVDSVAAPEESVEDSATTGADCVEGGGKSALKISAFLNIMFYKIYGPF